jgi:DNA-binding response OmpR family regulator
MLASLDILKMRILIVSGDNNLFEKLTNKFRNLFVVDTACAASKAIGLSESNFYDSIVVDSVLRDIEGLELCRMMRECGVDSPTAFLSGKEDRSDRLMCFDAGVDVIIPRYADIEEILAQVNALVRRNGSKSNGKHILKIGNISLDMKNRKFYLNSRCVYLRRKEFDLMEYLMVHKGRPVSKEELLEHVWEKGLDVMSNTVEVHIRSVRRKFEAEVGVGLVKTHRGFGYEIET